MAILVELSGYWAHYRVISTNHTTCLTYPTPPRTALLGKLGAVMGLTYAEVMEKWEPIVEMGFQWVSPFIEEIVMHKRFKLENKYWAKPDGIRSVLKNIYGWEEKSETIKSFDANKLNTLDSISYLRPADPSGRLVSLWFINSPKEEKIYEALQKPVYPLTYGTGEALVKIVSIRKVNAKLIKGEIKTKSSVPSEGHPENAYLSIMPRRAKGYKRGEDFVRVWTPQKEEITVVPLFGTYCVNEECFGVM
jgi:CRISPR-associated Cas5-like protein